MRSLKSRSPRALLIALAAIVAGGCSVLPLAQRLSARQFVDARYYQKDEVAIHATARTVLEAMNYTFVSGSRAEGTLELVAGVQPGGSALNPRQRRVFVSVRPVEGGSAHLRIGFMETSQEESAGGTVSTSNRALREEALYQAFWVRMAAQLGLPEPPPRPLGLDLEQL